MIVIIDYGMGNLRSVQKAFEKVGHAAAISSDPAQVADAQKLVLPGVGAFADAILELERRGLSEPLKRAIAADKPTLGICLGLQLLFDVSYENGEHRGLGVLPGKVVRFNLPREFKVPHMGWNQVRQQGKAPIFNGIADEAHFYFVHSYYVVPAESDVIAGQTDYGGMFVSSICRGRLYAMQFHPEKSQADGLQLLRNFAERG